MSEEIKKELDAFIEDLIESGKSEDDIFTLLADKTGKGILSAVRMYKQFLKDTGRVLSSEDRKQKIKELLDPLVKIAENGDKSIDLEAASKLLVDGLEMSAQAVRSNIRKFCEANGIPVVTRTIISKEEVEKHTATVVNGHAAGAAKKDIVAELVRNGVAEADAVKIYSRIAKDKDLLSTRIKHDLESMAMWIKENILVDTTRQVFCEKVESEFNLPPSTSSKLFNSWKFVLAYNNV